MPAYLSPGIYTWETDFSFYVKQISTSSAAMVGVTEKGPVNKPVLVTSWEQFINKFGSYINEGYLAYAARSFFDNGGSVLYVCRIAHYTDITDKSTLTAMESNMTIANREATPSPALQINAANPGTWGDRISVSIEDGSLDPANAFNLIVKYKDNIVEVFKELSMDEASANHVELMINEVSDYITVSDLSPSTGTAEDRPALGTYQLVGGNNGLSGVTDSDYIGDPSQHTYAENRKDLLFIADTPYMLEPLEVVDFRKGQGIYTHAAFNSSYAALYYPWLEISDPITARKKYIPPCGAVAGCCARSDQKTYVWWAPAGIDRGRIFNAVSVSYKTSRGERDVLYPEGINVIAVFPDTGINIWGQKTLQSQPSAVDRVNVRRLMMYMEEAISESSRFVVFEPNNPQTWRALGRLINPFLQDIKEKGGLYDYAFQCDEETNTPVVIDRNEMIARVFVKPTKTAEFIELNFILTGTGADFSEII